MLCLLPSPALPTPAAIAAPSSAKGAAVSAQVWNHTALGGMIHFPARLGSPDWADAIAALDRLKRTLGAGAYVRWDMLWHETHWSPNGPQTFGYDRIRYIVNLIAARGLRSLMQILPHPWPGSEWDGGPTSRDWGAPKPEWFPRIAQRYRESVIVYREALRAAGLNEQDHAVQWGNEPASGHPGGDGTLLRGTWSGHALWTELNRDQSAYGYLPVIAPALSMLDQPVEAVVETATSAVPPLFNWTSPVDRRAMHFRYYKPTAANPYEYAKGYVAALERQAWSVYAMPWPTGRYGKELQRRDGLWVTEGYLAQGDGPEPRAESWKRVLAMVRRGIPGVRVFCAYRFYPSGGPGGIDWSVPLDAQVQVSSRWIEPQP